MNRSFAGDSAAPPGRFFLPGPTEVHPEVLLAQTRPMIGHRGPAIQELMRELQSGLESVFFTERPVFLFTSSATGAMEAGVRNAAGGRVLSLVNGAFSRRFADIARSCGCQVDEIEVGWGDAHDPQAVESRLRDGPYEAVTVVHSETSTGVLNDIRSISEVVGNHGGTLMLVDSVSGFGAAEIRTDEWGLDFLLTGSQKAFALPPGLAFGVASERMMERSVAAPRRGYYFDLQRFASNHAKAQTPTTPAISLMQALRVQLERMRSETMEARWARHAEMARRTWEWVEEMRAAGLEMRVLAPEGYRSPSVTNICLPESLKGPAVVESMAERGWVIATGYGKLKETSIRIGHMGEHTLTGLEALLSDLGEVVS